MSKRYNIKWTEDDNRELRRRVKNFNAKIKRLEEKLSPQEARALPERVSVRELKELIETRQDLKRELNALERFSRKGAEELVDVPTSKYNLKTTKWQKQEMARRVGVLNRKRNKRLEEISKIEVKSRGEGLGYTIGDIGMGKVDAIALEPLKAFTPSMSRSDLNKRFKGIRKESQTGYWDRKTAQLRQNFVNGLIANYEGVSRERVMEIVKAVENMTFEEFYQKFMSETGIMEIVSPVPGQDYGDAMEEQLTAIESIYLPNKQGS